MKKSASLIILLTLATGAGLKLLDISNKQQVIPSEASAFISDTLVSKNLLADKGKEEDKEEGEEGKEVNSEKEETVCETSESLLLLIQEERKQLTTREQDVEEKIAKLEVAKARIQLEIENLQNLRNDVNIILEKRAKMQTDDVERLVNLYTSMKPKDAARLMNGIDPEVSVMVLGTMVERSAAPILANMEDTRAQAISKIILERSKLPGDQRLDNIKINK